MTVLISAKSVIPPEDAAQIAAQAIARLRSPEGRALLLEVGGQAKAVIGKFRRMRNVSRHRFHAPFTI